MSETCMNCGKRIERTPPDVVESFRHNYGRECPEWRHVAATDGLPYWGCVDGGFARPSEIASR